MGPIHESDLDLRVSDLLTDDLNWNKTRVDQFLPEFSSQIQNIKSSKEGAEDIHVWIPLQSGIYSTNSGYNAQAQSKGPPDPRPLVDHTRSHTHMSIATTKGNDL